jgi:mannose-6-phosphate isomerase-like protein (cupin superfamily)
MNKVHGYGCFDDDLPRQRKDAEEVLEKVCMLGAVTPPSGLKQKILGQLGFAGDELNLNNLPATDKYANYLSWLEVIQPLLPQEPVETIFIREIRKDESVAQMLVVSKVDVPEEVHEEYAESFFILEGRCACTIGGEVFELSAGDYLDIPLHIPHDVRLLSPQVTAILQYQFTRP